MPGGKRETDTVKYTSDGRYDREEREREHANREERPQDKRSNLVIQGKK